MYIRIVKRPAGEAPEWVRDAWIGVRLPTKRDRPRDRIGLGVLSGPHGHFQQLLFWLRGKTFRVTGYAVNALEAVELLSVKNAEAAEWWRSNCPRLLDGHRNLVFQPNECEADAR